MRFQMPEKLDELSLEDVTKLYEAALAEAQELNAIPDAEITAEQATELVKLFGYLTPLTERIDALESEGAPTAEEIAAARAGLAAPVEAEVVEEEDENVDPHVDDAEVVEEAEVEQRELVAAGARPATFASRASRNTRKPDKADPVDERAALKAQALSIRAAANIRGFESGQELDLDDLAKAYTARAKMFANSGRELGAGRKVGKKAETAVRSTGSFLTAGHERFAVAQLHKPENEFTLTEDMSVQEQYDLIRRAASEKRLAGGSLTAAMGWCAPSEIIFGFLELESADGLLSIPEITARRGGIQFTKGPQLTDMFTAATGGTFGWDMTEATVEAGLTDKPVFDMDCPTWEEIRLRATGWAARVALLTETAYPELVKRYLGLALTTHARLMNARTIQAISTLIGSATVFAPVALTAGNSSGTADFLASLELNALRVREQYSMSLNSTLEGVFPLWITAVIRSELSRRDSDDGTLMSVPDAKIIQWFRDRKINPQFVRDYQGINSGALNVAGGGGTAAWTKLPNVAEYMLYPAGSFVRLGSDVIDLDSVYDQDNLTKNQYLAAFFEEGYAIANTGGSGVKVSVSMPNTYGLVGGRLIGV